MPKKILVTGGSGLLGQYLNIALSKEYEIHTLYQHHAGNCINYSSSQIELCDRKKLEKLFLDFQPAIVVHTAAVSNPQKALAADINHVYKTNVDVTAHLAELCKATGALLVYTSTDLVYAGYRGSLLKETAKLAPKTLYAETKIMGEVKIQRIGPRYLILRTALLIGMGIGHTSCSFEKMVMDLLHGQQVDVFTDQIRSPLVIEEAADILRQLIACGIENRILNFGGNTKISRAQLAEIAYRNPRLQAGKLNMITMEQAKDIVPVEDVSLDVSQLIACGITYEPFYEQVHKEVLKIIDKAG
ncbi:MAG: sugar nucleotide-binding protein [Ignavibacteriales bacterium]|nr:sugar nucleotide-binding protein [Ignavibacteriales bacterium]